MTNYPTVKHEKEIKPEELTEEELKAAVNGHFKILECGECGEEYRDGGFRDGWNNLTTCPHCEEDQTLPL